jgi:hypothetical protein
MPSQYIISDILRLPGTDLDHPNYDEYPEYPFWRVLARQA